MSAGKDTVLNINSSPSDKLEFQNFSTSSGGTRPSSPSGAGTSGYTNYQSSSFVPEAGSGGSNNGEGTSQNKSWYQLEYYQQYFDVDSNQVGKRMLASVLPKQNFNDLISSNPDLYGPFWIATTVTFLVFITDSIGVYVHPDNQDKAFTYRFDKLASAASLLYGIITLIPLGLWAVVRYLNYSVKLIELIALYGYALTIWMPITIIAITPSLGVEWVLTIMGASIASLFCARNLYPMFQAKESEATWGTRNKNLSTGTIMTILVVATQVGIALTFQLYLFHREIPVSSSNSTTP